MILFFTWLQLLHDQLHAQQYKEAGTQNSTLGHLLANYTQESAKGVRILELISISKNQIIV